MTEFFSLLVSGISYGAVLSLVSIGFLVLYKATGVINFAHGDLVTLGAYLAFWGIDTLELPYGAAYVLAVILLFLVGVVIERTAYAPLRRRPTVVVMVSTLAASVVIQGALASWQGPDPKSLPSPVGDSVVTLFGVNIAAQRIVLTVVAALAIGAVFFVFERTPFGRQVRAVATDPDTARLVGVLVRRNSIVVFGLSAALAGLAGLLVGPLTTISLNFGFIILVNAFAAIVVGGFINLQATVAAAMAIGILQQVAGAYVFTNYAETFPFVILFIVIAMRPEGLVSTVRSRL